jgi:holliday junction DNA helicase RuvA
VKKAPRDLRIQHVGSKIALAILSVLAPKDLFAAISHKDVEGIDAVPGVGAKVAKRIVRELRNKIGELNLAAPAQTFSASSNGHAGKAR